MPLVRLPQALLNLLLALAAQESAAARSARATLGCRGRGFRLQQLRISLLLVYDGVPLCRALWLLGASGGEAGPTFPRARPQVLSE